MGSLCQLCLDQATSAGQLLQNQCRGRNCLSFANIEAIRAQDLPLILQIVGRQVGQTARLPGVVIPEDTRRAAWKSWRTFKRFAMPTNALNKCAVSLSAFQGQLSAQFRIHLCASRHTVPFACTSRGEQGFSKVSIGRQVRSGLSTQGQIGCLHSLASYAKCRWSVLQTYLGRQVSSACRGSFAEARLHVAACWMRQARHIGRLWSLEDGG